MGKSIKKEMMRNNPACASTPEEIMKWEIAKELGVSQVQVSRIENKVLKEFKDGMIV